MPADWQAVPGSLPPDPGYPSPAPDSDTRDLVEAIQELPANQRASVHLFYYEGYSTEEIASILGQRPGTIRSHLSRARETLRQKLKGGF